MHLIVSHVILAISLSPEDPPGGRLGIPEVKQILAAFVQAAETNTNRVEGRLSQDALADYLLRAAAKAAAENGASARSFLFALGVGFDDSDLLRENRLLRPFLQQVESNEDRRRRLRNLGTPTLRGRHDWLLHFAVSAALTAQLGALAADSAALAKEFADARPGGSGFSFADLAADYSGITFARMLLNARGEPRKTLTRIAERFRGQDVLPALDDLEEGLTATRLAEKYGDAADPRFRKVCDGIRAKLQQMPGLNGIE